MDENKLERIKEMCQNEHNTLGLTLLKEIERLSSELRFSNALLITRDEKIRTIELELKSLHKLRATQLG